MAWAPFAVHKRLPENDTQPHIEPRAFIAHSAGGGSELFGFWMNPASRGLECHFFIDDDEDQDGYATTTQYMDTEIRADANGEANDIANSLETASSVGATEPWTPPQVKSIIRLIVWECRTHPAILDQLMTHPRGAGLAWHIMFQPATGTESGPWSSRRKACPGPARIEQFKNVIVPAVQAQLRNQTETKDWFDMATKAELEAVVADALAPLKIALVAMEQAAVKRDTRVRDRIGAVRGYAKTIATKVIGSDAAVTALAVVNNDGPTATAARAKLAAQAPNA